MASYLVLFLPVWFLVLSAISTPSPAQTPDTVPQLPRDILSQIVDLSDKETSFMLGCSSKCLNEMTEIRNKHNRQLRMKEHCGVGKYLDMTSNGYFLFTSSIGSTNFQNINVLDILKQDTLCNRALTSNIREISERLTQLTIRLPSVNIILSAEVISAIDSYFESLIALFKSKSSFKKITVLASGEWGPRHLHEQSEERLFKIFSQLSINELILRAKLRNPDRLMNPTMRKISAQEEFFQNINSYPGLPNLQSFGILSL
jgi:hypothetical protein